MNNNTFPNLNNTTAAACLPGTLTLEDFFATICEAIRIGTREKYEKAMEAFRLTDCWDGSLIRQFQMIVENRHAQGLTPRVKKLWRNDRLVYALYGLTEDEIKIPPKTRTTLHLSADAG